MPTPLLTRPVAAGNAAGAKPEQVQIIERRRFATATYPHTEIAETRTHTMTTAQQNPQPVDLPAFGYLRCVWLFVTLTTATNVATVAVREDAPWSVLAEVQLQDVSTQALIQVTGYELYLLTKFGGYGNAEDPTTSSFYSAITTGSGGTAGSAAFAVRLPVEIVQRDAFGALLNQSQQQPFRVKYILAAATEVYSTNPTNLPTVTIVVIPEMYAMPPGEVGGVANQIAPDGHGTTQFWTRGFQSIATATAQPVRLARVGGMLRNVIYVCRDGSNLRSNSIFPAQFEFRWEGRPMYADTRDLVRHRMGRAYGYTAANLDTGVFVFPFNDEMDGKPGGELRDSYIGTNGASRVELYGTFAVGSVTTLINDVYAGKRG